ncbi:NHLP family bacteriocin export ABC transporter peptidase/permease/ATPase subunit [Solimicrobium silvestre]|uniref:Cyclolysin secretion/processing ATP-binding protein CyaB n=1 Tax=Solimicrobium silvestre TaxID=2099400 RepID=A0A2S9GYM4_9BURK|nr:NHLP family bacteriocin export ABC transporter peptidase/permease/ATPase subunit [Solimicrobium silvestre]PRC92800.1 NHLM bacteriocin system ABC transporter, peptidase/ATP-binding protein [Solimicrobium silvestre]
MINFRQLAMTLRTKFSKQRSKTPLIFQLEAVECGAASLAMILAHYKKYLSLEELRVSCGVSRNGSRASHIVNAARKYGLLATGFRKEPAELRTMSLPMIIFWNFNHFVVVDGFEGDTVLVNDPGLGRRRIDAEEFDQSFTGIVLAFEKGPAFVPSGRPPNLFRSLRQRLGGTRQGLIYLILIGLSLVIPGLVIPIFSSVFIDRVLIGGLQSWLFPLLSGMLLTSVLLALLTWLQKYYLIKLDAKIALSTSARFFWHVLRLPVGFYQQRSAGDIGSRLAISERIANILSEDLVGAVLSLMTATFFASMMLFYDVSMTLVTVAVVLLNVVVMRFVAVRQIELNQRMAIDRGKVIGTSMNGLRLIETLKASGSESDFFTRWAGYQARLTNSMQQMNRTSIILNLIPKFLTGVSSIFILGIGGMRVMQGGMSIGMLVAFQALAQSFVNPVNALVALSGKMQGFQGDMDRLDDVMRSPVENITAVEENAENLLCAKLEGHLELRNVTFGYSRLEPPLLKNFSLTLQPGQRIALVGASGCGKSTVSKLVIGLCEPWEGSILFDGKPRNAWPRQQLLNSVAAVDQDICIFSGTVRENLNMWDTTIPHKVVVDAARDACVHDVISSRPGGYDSVVAEGGGNFSGGQRQRLEIARALSSNPRLLILDEATSALDPLTEKIVENNLRRRGCSCLVVAHRLSAIRDCDEIILLDKGVVMERGSHQDLIELNGHYARLISNE